jgi:signal transduction histidine kinase
MKDEGHQESLAAHGQRPGDPGQQPDEELRYCLQDLEAAKHELEVFLYAVSHDLRAPLRAIQGFSQILLKKSYSDMLDAKSKDYLARMGAASRRIDQMVIDLLQLSHLAKAGMELEDLDLSGIARRITDCLGKSAPERQVKFMLAEDIRAYGDKHLLTIVLENLLGNAWKFTEKKEGAIIEFGVTAHGNERAYFVRDNGIGFDMTRADRLFQPFQKFHNEREFPGSGIGLATVYRIIRRFGGKTWAESEAGKGTAIYFTLGQTP